jgi:hypothetical protein
LQREKIQHFSLVFLFAMVVLCMLCIWSPPVQSVETMMNENTSIQAVAPATNNTLEKSSNREMPLVGVRDLRGSKSSDEQSFNFILKTCTMRPMGCAEIAKSEFEIKIMAHVNEDIEKAIGSGGERVYALGKTIGNGPANII